MVRGVEVWLGPEMAAPSINVLGSAHSLASVDGVNAESCENARDPFVLFGSLECRVDQASRPPHLRHAGAS